MAAGLFTVDRPAEAVAAKLSESSSEEEVESSEDFQDGYFSPREDITSPRGVEPEADDEEKELLRTQIDLLRLEVISTSSPFF